MTRRGFLATASTAAVGMAQSQPLKKSSLGIATTCYLTVRRFSDTLEFLEHANRLGAAGIQSALTSLEPAYLDRVKARLDQTGMYMEAMSPLPRVDMEKFVATVEAAKRVGALCVRVGCLSGRRYETFPTLDEWRKFVVESKSAIGRAVAVCEQKKLPFAMENHKDWTTDEYIALLKAYSSEYFGACLDLGNNLSLLDDPVELVERAAPYVLATHIKDMGVAEYPEGFLLSEVVIGEGFLNLSGLMATIRKARPKVKMTLEMITRDPLKVPVFTDKYWATFPERNGVYLARTVRMVRAKHTKLPMLSTLSKEKQLAVEENNVRRCLAAMPA